MASFGDVAVQKNERNKVKKPKAASQRISDLTSEELKQCKVFFKTFDRDSSQMLDIWELRLALEALGQTPTDSDLKRIMGELDTNNNGTLEFSEFLSALQIQKKSSKKKDDESDLVGAFVAMGGKEDKSGFITAEVLRKVIKDDYALTIKIDELLDDLDSNNDGFVNFEEFKTLLGN